MYRTERRQALVQRRCIKSGNHQAGFALIDVMLGIAILTVALLGIALAFRQSAVTTVSARNYNQATYYAQQALEKLKVYDGQTTGTWTGTTTIPASGIMPAFTLTTAVLATGDSPEYDSLDSTVKAKLVPVRATVTWREISGGSGNVDRSLKVVSYYYLK